MLLHLLIKYMAYPIKMTYILGVSPLQWTVPLNFNTKSKLGTILKKNQCVCFGGNRRTLFTKLIMATKIIFHTVLIGNYLRVILQKEALSLNSDHLVIPYHNMAYGVAMVALHLYTIEKWDKQQSFINTFTRFLAEQEENSDNNSLENNPSLKTLKLSLNSLMLCIFAVGPVFGSSIAILVHVKSDIWHAMYPFGALGLQIGLGLVWIYVITTDVTITAVYITTAIIYIHFTMSGLKELK